MSTHNAFVQALEAFLTRHKMNPTQFGHMALNDPSFVLRVRKGRSPSAKTIDRVREFMAGHEAKVSAGAAA